MTPNSPIRPGSRRHRILSHLSTGPKAMRHLHVLEESGRGHDRRNLHLAVMSLVGDRLARKFGDRLEITGLGRDLLDDLDSVRSAFTAAAANCRVFGLAA